MSEIDWSLFISIFALFVSTAHIIFDKWLDRWLINREKRETHEKFVEKTSRLQRKLYQLLNEAKTKLITEEHFNYITIINDQFFQVIPFMLNPDYSIEKLKEAELKIDKFYFDMATKFGGLLSINTSELAERIESELERSDLS